MTAHSLDKTLTAGNKSYDPAKAVYWVGYDTKKAAKLLGLKYRSMEECARDILAQFKEREFY